MNEMSHATPQAGHNSGYVPTPEEIREVLKADHEALLSRADELLAGFDRAPATVENEETAGRVGDFVKQISTAIKNVDTARTSTKEPYLAGGRAVDGFFNPLKEKLDKAKRALTDRVGDYQRRKAAEERAAREAAERQAREAEEAARKAAEEAERAAQTDDDLDAAIAAEEAARKAAEQAEAAKKAASASAADLSRSRGDYGSVASLRTTWAGELVDRAALDLEALREHLPEPALEQAIRSFVKAGGRTLRGARIFEKQDAVIR